MSGHTPWSQIKHKRDSDPGRTDDFRELARGWFCPDCRRIFSTPITTEDGRRWHNRACGIPMERALVVAR